MTTPTPIHIDPMLCEDSTLECYLFGMGIVVVVPVALWVMAHPVLAAAVVATTVVVMVTLAGLARGDVPLFRSRE